jgi:hypothetical protein
MKVAPLDKQAAENRRRSEAPLFDVNAIGAVRPIVCTLVILRFRTER